MKVPNRIKWKWAGHMAGVNDHRMSYRSDRWRANAVRITPVIREHVFGPSRIEYLMDGSDRRWKSWPAFRRALAKKCRP